MQVSATTDQNVASSNIIFRAEPIVDILLTFHNAARLKPVVAKKPKSTPNNSKTPTTNMVSSQGRPTKRMTKKQTRSMIR